MTREDITCLSVTILYFRRKEIKKTDRETNRGEKHLCIQRQSDLYPQNIASTDRTRDRRLEREYTPAKQSNSFSLMSWPHGAGSVTERLLLSSDGQMVVVFGAQLFEFGHQGQHQVLPRPPWAQTHHWRALQG